MAAGRLMLNRMRQLAASRVNFAFETTLASRSFVPWIAGLKRKGYRVHLLFLSLDNPELAVRRVAMRVRQGGHDVPEVLVRRRYERGLKNFFNLYLALADSWQLFDNSMTRAPHLIAAGKGTAAETVMDADTWRTLVENHRD